MGETLEELKDKAYKQLRDYFNWIAEHYPKVHKEAGESVG